MSRARIRLCIVTPEHWTASVGGAELQIKLLVERLTALDRFDIHYVTRRFDRSYEPDGYSLHRIAAREAVGGTFVFDTRGLLRLLKRLQPDVIYQRVACAYTGVATYFARRNKRRMVWHVSSDRNLAPLPWRTVWRSPLRRLNKSMIDYGARHADRIIVQNARQAELLRKYHGRTDVLRISNFHPVPVRPVVKPPECITVCWIGNLKPLKQPEMFVHLAADFRHHEHLKFVMVGAQQMVGQPWADFLTAVSRSSNLQYEGSQPPSRVEELLAGAHVLVNTSTVEGFPNTFIESWLRDVFVISWSVNPDAVFDMGRYGICAGGDYGQLKQALARAITDEGLRRETAKNSFVFARDQFSKENLDRIVELLEYG